MCGVTCESDLMAVLKQGACALPDDLGLLHGYMKLIAGLLAEKAHENQPTLALENAAGAEIETLLRLEALVAARVSEAECQTYACLRAKLDIWNAMTAPDSDEIPRELIVRSVRADVTRLADRRERRTLTGGFY